MRKRVTSLIALAVLLGTPVFGFERRNEQFDNEQSYLILPLPYSFPGIGDGIMALGLAGNVGGSNTDIFALQAFGDVQGTVLGIEEIFLLPNLLYLDLYGQKFSEITIQNYEQRGMNSDKDDFKYIEFNAMETLEAELTLTLFERRFELFVGAGSQKGVIPRLRDAEGEIIAELNPGEKYEQQHTLYGTHIDLTDDRRDPRKGVRFGARRSDSKARSDDDPTVYEVEYNVNFYIPIGEASAFALTYWGSDAHVTSNGIDDPEQIRENLGIGCTPDDDACLSAEQALVDHEMAANTKGNANSLGGKDRLRSYPQGRYQAAHSRMVGVEYRWNVSNQIRPFDFGIWKDVAAAIQVAPFYEIGTVSDNETDLWDETRESYGLGVRLVSKSGFVYRADYATGDEGNAFSIIFSYPW